MMNPAYNAIYTRTVDGHPVVTRPPPENVPLPIRGASECQPPSTKAWPGIYNFDVVQVGRELRGEKTTSYFYSEPLGKLFVEMNKACPFEVTINPYPADKVVKVRALPVYSVAGSLHDVVKRCANHSMPSDPSNYCFEHNDHLLRSDKQDAIYDENPEDGRLSVIVPVSRPSPGTNSLPLILRFMCLHSCNGGINRRALSIVFTLEVDGEVVGRKAMEVRICACPNRDRRLQEQKALRCTSPSPAEFYYRKKRKWEEGGTKSKSSVYFIVVQSKKVYDMLMTLKESLELAEKYKQASPSGVQAHREKDSLLQQSFNKVSQRNEEYDFYEPPSPAASRPESESEMAMEEDSSYSVGHMERDPLKSDTNNFEQYHHHLSESQSRQFRRSSESPHHRSESPQMITSGTVLNYSSSSGGGSPHYVTSTPPVVSTNNKSCSILVLQPGVGGNPTAKQVSSVQLGNVPKFLSMKSLKLKQEGGGWAYDDIVSGSQSKDRPPLRKTQSAKESLLKTAILTGHAPPTSGNFHLLREGVDYVVKEESADESKLSEEEQSLLRRAELLKNATNSISERNRNGTHRPCDDGHFEMNSSLVTLSEVASSLPPEKTTILDAPKSVNRSPPPQTNGIKEKVVGLADGDSKLPTPSDFVDIPSGD